MSEADLLVKEAVLGEPGGVAGLLAGLVHHAERAKARGITAADLMTSPAVTIRPDDTVEHAAKLMYDRKVKRLPVVDQGQAGRDHQPDRHPGCLRPHRRGDPRGDS